MTLEWGDLQKRAIKRLLELNKSQEYKRRLRFEFAEIDKQGARDYWINLLVENKKFDHNKNGLVLPWLLGITSIDPIASNIKHNIVYQLDFPDIDIDFLPDARIPIREFAAKRFGDDNVCSIGAWQTYGPKLALVDVARVIGIDPSEILGLTTQLPKEFDDMSFEDACNDESLQPFKLREFAKRYEAHKLDDGTVIDLFKMAYQMVGKIKAQLRHAGGLIISKVPIIDYIPLTVRDGVKTSEWTEGSKTQLSKFGFIKFDILGLKNLLYIDNACKKIKTNHDVTIDWNDMDPEEERAGWAIYGDGSRDAIRFDDNETLTAASNVKVDSIFQFETELAKSIIKKGGVQSFNDLVVYSSLGHPGPLPQVDEYIARRDRQSEWSEANEDPRIKEILKDTYSIIVLQEQLTNMWTKLAGFTAPEAEAARKAVAKKWVDQLKPIEEKWIRGASKTIGEISAREWWGKMVTFGRYAFNKSHVTCYVIIAYRCLWLKTNFPAEWWSSVMSDCHTEKLTKYMSAARLEGVKFVMMDCDTLTENFTATKGGEITPGVAAIKGVGASVVKKIIEDKINKFDSAMHFMEVLGKNNVDKDGKKEKGKTPVSRTVLEKLIKLGAFRNKCQNNKAEWVWYLYNKGKGSSATALRRLIKAIWCNWTIDEIEEERERKANEYRRFNHTKKTIPPYIKNWLPEQPKANRGPKASVLTGEIMIPAPTKTKKKKGDGKKKKSEYIAIEMTDEGFFDKLVANINTFAIFADDHEDIKIARKIEIGREHIEQLFDTDYTTSEMLAFEKEYLGFYWNSPMDGFVHRNQTVDYARQHGTLECVIENCEIRLTKKNETFYRLTVTDGTEFSTVMVWNDGIYYQDHIGDCEKDFGVFNAKNGVRMKVIWNDNYMSFNLRKNTKVIPLARK